MWIRKLFKAIGDFYDRHPVAGIATATVLGGVTGLAATGGTHLMNKSICKLYGGDFSAMAAAESAKKAYEASQMAIKAANTAKKTAVDTINLASQFVEK